MNPPYAAFAKHYDEVMGTVNYLSWSTYIVELIRYYHPRAVSVLDAACGTGTMCFLLEEKLDCRIDGFDLSRNMLHEARCKQQQHHSDSHFFEGDLRDFSVSRPYDILLCLQDSINYLTSDDELNNAFGAAASALSPNGVYIFDITTLYNLQQNFSFREIEIPTGNGKIVWKNRYDRAENLSIVDLVVYDSQSQAITQERHEQRIFSVKKIERLLSENGFSRPNFYHGFTFQPPSAHSEHIHVVSRKRPD